MRRLKRIIGGHDFGVGRRTSPRIGSGTCPSMRGYASAGAVVEPPEEIAQKTGARLQALAASPELAGPQAEYEVRSGNHLLSSLLGQEQGGQDAARQDWIRRMGASLVQRLTFDGTFENAPCQDENWRHVSPDSE